MVELVSTISIVLKTIIAVQIGHYHHSKAGLHKLDNILAK